MTVVVFDVNETLIDLAPLRPGFDRVLGSGATEVWFPTLLHLSGIANQLDRYEPFTVLGRRAVEIVAARRGVEIEDEDIDRLLAPFADLPAHPDVAPGLQRLADAGLRMAALTNSPPTGLIDRLAAAGIAHYFDEVMSVDPVRRFKPHPDVYRSGAATLGVGPSEMIMVAAHDWDLAGAAAVGARTAFIARPGTSWSFPDAPTYEGGDLIEVASRITTDSNV